MSAGDSDHPTEQVPLIVAWQRHVSDDRHSLDRLVDRYREEHRRYHTVDHLEAVIDAVIELAGVEHVDDLGAVVAAAMYHDAVYEPSSPTNERASARLARLDLGALGWPVERVEHVAALIEATDRHDSPPDIDHAVLFDADLSILGATPEAYSRYAAAVRAEYSHVDDRSWRSGRRSVLLAFLDRSAIYATVAARGRWETAARSNLATELASLNG